jgi:hypothetical protein
VGVWSYDAGDGLVGPHGSETVRVRTDAAGRYRVPKAPRRLRGPSLRLVDFHLVVYKRGYVGYRSDRTEDGQPRDDFFGRRNEIALRKWQQSEDSHARHLEFLAAPPDVQQRAKWERELANRDLYRELGGGLAPGAPPPDLGGGRTPERTEPVAALEVLDATALLTPDELRARTGSSDTFVVEELADLARTHFYHGVHLRAAGLAETYDVAYRVWKDPPGGLQPVIDTFRATLPNVPLSDEVTDESYVIETDTVRAVAFIDRERVFGVLFTCGVEQCADLATAIVLARYLRDGVERLRRVPVSDSGELLDGTSASPASPAPSPTEAAPGVPADAAEAADAAAPNERGGAGSPASDAAPESAPSGTSTDPLPSPDAAPPPAREGAAP